ncbi:MAG TPA: hypothetical protein VMT51_03640 [Dongiaceae bacterium]|nr:hypothetical protein [Dongiaceae bacterium]
MKLSRLCRSAGMILCLLSGSAAVFAQRPHANVAASPVPGAYDVSRDVSLQGTVLKYTENSATPPIGTHVLLQTASGTVDVHLGDARLLHSAKLNLAQGTSVRFVGQSSTVRGNTVFLARLVQVGTQVVAIRSSHGLPLAAAGARANQALLANASQQGGAR